MGPEVHETIRRCLNGIFYYFYRYYTATNLELKVFKMSLVPEIRVIWEIWISWRHFAKYMEYIPF